MSDSSVPRARPTPSKRWSGWFQTFWQGRGKPATRWGALIGGLLALTAAWFLSAIGGPTIRWPLPLKFVGIGAFLLATGALIWGLRLLLRVLVQLGVKRLLIRLAIGYLIAVIITGLIVQTKESGTAHWTASAASVTSWIGSGVSGVIRGVVRTPDTITFAATGRRQPVRLPDVEWVGDVPPTPIVANSSMETGSNRPSATAANTSATPGASVQPDLRIGDTVRVVGTGGAALNARATPGGSGQIVGKFRSGATFQIIDGPQSIDGDIWWKVSGGTIEGWCAAEYLARVR